MTAVLLHDYYRSSAAYRVRIALNLKGVEYQRHAVNLVEGEQQDAGYRALNPQGFVPMLEIDGHRLTQSLAIIGYLDATRPEPPLIPSDPADAAHVRAMALAVACDIHPLNNLRVLKYLSRELGQPEEARDAWYRHWVAEGLDALGDDGADQRRRFPVRRPRRRWPTSASSRSSTMRGALRSRSTDYPTLRRVDENASALGAFAEAHPDRQEAHA